MNINSSAMGMFTNTLAAAALIIIVNMLVPGATTAASAAAAASSCAAAPKSTKLHGKQVLLLSRRKRYIFFTPGSAVTATMSYTKALAAKFPRGVNIIGEADFSYPLPTQVSDWFVKPRTPGAVKPSRIDVGIDANNINIINGRAPTSMTVNRTTSLRPNDYWHRSPIYIHARPSSSSSSYSASSSITRLRPGYAAYAAAAPDNNDDMYYNSRPAVQPHHATQPRPNSDALDIDDDDVTSDRYYYRRPTSTAQQRQRTNAQRKQQQQQPQHQQQTPNQQRQQQPVSYTEWRHHGGYRARRDLYTKFESVAAEHGIDIRACLLRTICEAKHYLLPRGRSFFHDMLRILFYIPTIAATSGEPYAVAMRSTRADCVSEYRSGCQYSILGLLLSRQKSAFG